MIIVLLLVSLFLYVTLYVTVGNSLDNSGYTPTYYRYIALAEAMLS